MGLQSYRWRIFSYVLQTGLKIMLAAPRIQQGPIIWSSRHVVHSVIFACSFLSLLWFHTTFRSTTPVPNAWLCVLCLCTWSWRGNGNTRGIGNCDIWGIGNGDDEGCSRRMDREHLPWLTCHVAESNAMLSDTLGKGFILNCSVPSGLISSRINCYWVQSSKRYQFQTDICKYSICTGKVVLGFGSSVLDFFCLLLRHSYWHRKK